jgi:hypothetical protein
MQTYAHGIQNVKQQPYIGRYIITEIVEYIVLSAGRLKVFRENILITILRLLRERRRKCMKEIFEIGTFIHRLTLEDKQFRVKFFGTHYKTRAAQKTNIFILPYHMLKNIKMGVDKG